VSTYSRLGRGLESLIPSSGPKGDPQKLDQSEIKLSLIKVNPYQPRQVFAPEALDALVTSIKQFGVAQPILVRPKEGGYELIAGERRFRASVKAGLETIPAVVRDYSDEESLQLALIENLDREDLNPIEEARGYKRLIDEFSFSQQKVADCMHKSRSAIANTLRLLQLPEEVQDGVMKERLSEGHARALLGVKDATLIPILYKEIVQQHLSVRQTERRVRDVNHPKILDDSLSWLEEAQTRVSSTIGLSVSIKGNDQKGKVEIKYTSQKDLERLLQVLGHH